MAPTAPYDLLDDADIGRGAYLSDSDNESNDSEHHPLHEMTPADQEELLQRHNEQPQPSKYTSSSEYIKPVPLKTARKRSRRRQRQNLRPYRQLPTKNAASMFFILLALMFAAYYFIPTFFGLSNSKPPSSNDNALPSATAATDETITTTPSQLTSNGTHLWKPTTILVSLDGLRADYLEQGYTPNLLSLSKRGIRAKYLEPTFPSLTFVNHWTLLTGLHAESHGIVANDFWDPTTQKEFNYKRPDQSWDPEWWGGEPIWATAERLGIRAANIMWPGPPEMMSGESHSYQVPFKDHVDWSEKTKQVSTWLDLPLDERPQFISVYLPEIDQAGHASGPDSENVIKRLRYADDFAQSIFQQIDDRNLADIVNIIFVSDHGMASTSNERIVYLDDALGQEGFEGIAHKEGWPSCGLRFKPHINETDMLERLKQTAIQSNGGIEVYTHDTMPERYHFSGNPRIAPIYVVPKIGWVVSDKVEHLSIMKGDYRPRGNHGYDPQEPEMHAIFVAHGPFAEDVKRRRRQLEDTQDRTVVIDGFKNIEIYNLIARLLQISTSNQASNNGTIGFWDNILG